MYHSDAAPSYLHHSQPTNQPSRIAILSRMLSSALPLVQHTFDHLRLCCEHVEIVLHACTALCVASHVVHLCSNVCHTSMKCTKLCHTQLHTLLAYTTATLIHHTHTQHNIHATTTAAARTVTQCHPYLPLHVQVGERRMCGLGLYCCVAGLCEGCGEYCYGGGCEWSVGLECCGECGG